MKRLKDEFLNKLEAFTPLTNLAVLEIGCGIGGRTVDIADRCDQLSALEPDPKLLAKAKELNARSNISYLLGSAGVLPFEDQTFEIIIFTLSLHHVPINKMATAIGEAVRVTKKDGFVVFLEPQHSGSFFEAELLFDACDGDERKEKARAYFEMLAFRNYREVAEIEDETIFSFESAEDFTQDLNPKKNLSQLVDFLETHQFILNAKRRINIFQV